MGWTVGTRGYLVTSAWTSAVAFSRSSDCPGVERQFLEPSTAKSSLPSRAPHAK